MSTDIHMFAEVRVSDEWVMVNRIEGRGADRNYTRFAALAGVRGDGPDPPGLPEDVSAGVRWHVDRWEGGAHSCGYGTPEKIAHIFLEADDKLGRACGFAREYPVQHYLDFHLSGGEFRIVYFFDN